MTFPRTSYISHAYICLQFGLLMVPFAVSIAYWIAFGPHGPRAQPPKGEGWKIFFKVLQLTGASVLVFYAVHAFAGKQPATMSKEWQEASNEYAKVSGLRFGVMWIARDLGCPDSRISRSDAYRFDSYRPRR